MSWRCLGRDKVEDGRRCRREEIVGREKIKDEDKSQMIMTVQKSERTNRH